MRRLNRHVGSSVFGAIMLVLLVVLAVDVISALINEVEDIRNDYTFKNVLVYIGLTFPSRIYNQLPLASLIGCLIGLGLLASNSELVIMRSAGVSVQRIVWFVLRPALLLVLLGYLLGEYVIPYSDQYAESQRSVQRLGIESQSSSSGVWNREGNEFIHFNAVYPGGLVYGVTRYRFDDNQNLVEASFSQEARFIGDYWQEENVRVTRLYGSRTETENLIKRRWDSGFTPDLLNLLSVETESLSMQSLYRYTDYLQQQGRDSADRELIFWQKALQPLSIAGLVFIAISFIFGPLRQVTMGNRIFIGVVVGIAFRTSQDLLGPSSLVFGFSPLLAVAMPIILCMAIGLVLLRRAG